MGVFKDATRLRGRRMSPPFPPLPPASARTDTMLQIARLRLAPCLLACALGPAALGAQDVAPPRPPSRDSVPAVRLPTITVTRTEEPPDLAPAAVTVLDQDALRRGRLTLGLDEALAGVPGVHVANRYNFSLDQRLSIRGFGSRAAFGVRGIRILLDGVPQTLPDGQSQLSNVELGLSDRLEILRSGSSALYGNAGGGVIAIRTEAAGPEPFSQRLTAEAGAFGLRKWLSRSAASAGAWSGTLGLSRLTIDGFRQHSAADLRQLAATVGYAASDRTLATLRVAAADAPMAENPGALTAAELAANRDSAGANNIVRRADKDVTQQQLSLSVRHVAPGGHEAEAAVFALRRDLANPLATNTIIDIDRRVLGARVQGTAALGGSGLRATAGLDLQRMRDERLNRLGDGAGSPTDSVTVDQRETVTELGPFAQVTWTPDRRLLLRAGTRYDRVGFTVLDRHRTDGVDQSGSRTFEAWSGHGGASLALDPALVLHLGLGRSFETPTTTELANQPGGSGGFNDRLGPQRARSAELGLRGRAGSARYAVTAFRIRVDSAIVQFQEVGGRAFFQNAGRTGHDGVEVELELAPLPALRLLGSYTYGRYRFLEYRPVSGATVDTLDGKRLPGVPSHFARLGVRAEPLPRLWVDVEHTLSSEVPADDRNLLSAPGWGAGVTSLRLGLSARIGDLAVEPFLGVHNLWDRSYVGSVTVNGFGGRVFEPAPRRFAWVGMTLGWVARGARPDRDR